MAIVNTQSTQVANAAAGKTTESVSYKGRLASIFFEQAQGAVAGDANSTQDLVVLPPGKWRFNRKLSEVFVSAFGAARTLSIGHTAFTKPDGTAVAAAAAAITNADTTAAAGGAFQPGAALTTDGTFLIDSKGPVTIQSVVAGGTIPAAATIKGTLTFQTGG